MDLFVYVLLFGLVSVSIGDENNRKTYLVRYSNGQQTIPVTVVLDYKKQVEYVINMNSRTPTKSVTFYDFKERTIAYKDMTNRECFLGRLTHETLHEENELLSHLQNPVNINPVVLNLASSRSSLTPTEVKNIAGDKIAMFCGKMSTWLLQEINSRSKRQIESNRRHSSFNPSYQSLPLYRTDVRIHNTQNEHRRHFQVPDENRNELPLPAFSEDDRNNLFHHYLRADDALNDNLTRQYSHPLSSSVPLYKSHQNNDVITFHPRDPKHRSNVHPSVGIHQRNPNPFEAAADRFGNSSRNTWPVQYHPRLPPGTGTHDFVASKIPTQTGGNPLFPANFEYTHQLRKNTQSNHGASDAQVNTKLLRDLNAYNSEIQTIHFRSNQLKGSLQTETLHPRNGEADSRRYAVITKVPSKTSKQTHENYSKDQTNQTVLLSKSAESTQYHLNGIPGNNNVPLQKIDFNDTHSKNGVLNRYKPYVYEQVRTTTSRPYISDLDSVDTLRDRSDLPYEDLSFVTPQDLPENNDGLFRGDQKANTDFSPTNAVVVEGIPSQERAQNTVKLFTPVEVVVDVGNTLEQDNPKSTSDFNNRIPDALPKASKAKLVPLNPSRRRINDSRVIINPSYQRAERPTRRPLPREPSTTILPPGVTIYPRHPNAPFAQLSSGLPPKRTQSYGQGGNRHHQRHRRKKNRRNQRCCSQGRKSCCQGGQCCTSRKLSPRTSSGQSKKSTVRQMPPPVIPSDIQNDIGPTKEDLCDIKKMCRTLYQSTKAVKVCKINDVPDC